jgi:sodium-dependent dicarboxylate transporter 2/3/5
VPLAASLAQSLSLDPLPAILGAGLGASLGFMMPISTPPNAIIYGTKLVPLREMMITGLFLDLLGIAVIVLLLSNLLPVLGL